MNKTITLFLLALTSFNAASGVWEEREYLQRYVEQVEALNETLLNRAQQSADPNARIQMNYQLMRSQSEEVLNKIKHYLNEPMEPYQTLHSNAFPKQERK